MKEGGREGERKREKERGREGRCDVEQAAESGLTLLVYSTKPGGRVRCISRVITMESGSCRTHTQG